MKEKGRKKVIYYTQVFYLDAALEYIKLASLANDFYVFIELTPESLKANIFNLSSDLSQLHRIEKFENIISDLEGINYSHFFVNCKSVEFVIHPHRRSLSVSSFIRSVSLNLKFAKIKPDYIHFEDVSLRAIGLLPSLVYYRKMAILNVHDPKPHSGEKEIKKEIIKKVFFFLITNYVCFSEYSKLELKSFLDSKKKVHVLRLLPYSCYRAYTNRSSGSADAKVTFIGRISRYKGIDLFLDAIPLVLDEFPRQKFCIAGRLVAGYNPEFNKYSFDTLEIINEHLSNEVLVDIIDSSKVIVCPYLDATQSGVIMTAYALDCPVIVTPVGGLPEYVIPGVTGLITEKVDSRSLAHSIILFLKGRLSSNRDLSHSANYQHFSTENLKALRLLYNNM